MLSLCTIDVDHSEIGTSRRGLGRAGRRHKHIRGEWLRHPKERQSARRPVQGLNRSHDRAYHRRKTLAAEVRKEVAEGVAALVAAECRSRIGRRADRRRSRKPRLCRKQVRQTEAVGMRPSFVLDANTTEDVFLI